MVTPNDLYKMTPEKVDHDMSCLSGCYYNHVPEVGVDPDLAAIVTELVEIRYLKDWCFDSRRIWRLATVWFENQPVMIIQNAGREGDDFYDRFITDNDRYLAMCFHLRSLLPLESTDNPLVVDADTPIASLTEFYGNKLGGYFDYY